MIRRTLCLVAVSMFLTAFLVDNQTAVHAAGQPLVVIVSTATPLSNISTALLRRTFLGEATEYESGKRLIPINQPLDAPGRVAFDRALLSLQPQEVGRFWIDRRIRDQSGPPKAAPSAEMAVRLVMSLPGAISYVHADRLNDKVRALTIDGRSPGAVDYLLER